jgi:hypothetical protein
MLAIGPAGLLGLLQADPQATSDSDDPFESISNFFDSGLWSAIALMLQIFVVLLWLALAYWTYQDARRRVESPVAVAGCVALSVLLPFLGSVIYLIVRPPEYLDEARERELELLALEQRLGELGDAEGQEIVARMLAREGLPAGGDAAGVQRALRQAGVASQDDVRDLDLRLTEIEFRMRLIDGNTPEAAAAAAAEAGSAERRRERELERERRRELPETAAGRPADAGRSIRWRRARREPEAYD